MKPLIGVTSGYKSGKYQVNELHLKIISEVGGIPVVLVPYDDPEGVVEKLDGFLLTEGPDVHPYNYGEDPMTQLTSVDVERDSFEITLVKLAYGAGKPILGVSRGMHVMNIAFGGTLYQDISFIPKAVKHFWDINEVKPWSRLHSVKVKMESRLFQILKENLDIKTTVDAFVRVNSFHHQAIKKLGDIFLPVAYSSDGIIEAIEAENSFAIGVQWRPEYLPEMKVLYKVLVEASLREQGENHHSSETSGSLHDTNQT